MVTGPLPKGTTDSSVIIFDVANPEALDAPGEKCALLLAGPTGEAEPGSIAGPILRD